LDEGASGRQGFGSRAKTSWRASGESRRGARASANANANASDADAKARARRRRASKRVVRARASRPTSRRFDPTNARVRRGRAAKPRTTRGRDRARTGIVAPVRARNRRGRCANIVASRRGRGPRERAFRGDGTLRRRRLRRVVARGGIGVLVHRGRHRDFPGQVARGTREPAPSEPRHLATPNARSLARNSLRRETLARVVLRVRSRRARRPCAREMCAGERSSRHRRSARYLLAEKAATKLARNLEGSRVRCLYGQTVRRSRCKRPPVLPSAPPAIALIAGTIAIRFFERAIGVWTRADREKRL
jgi:hypothetical protein